MANNQDSNVVHNQPYDESVEVSDGEDIASATASPRVPHAPPPGGGGAQQASMYGYGGGAVGTPHPAAAQVANGGRGMGYEEVEEEEEEDSQEEQSDSDESEVPHRTISGPYDPSEFEHLSVSSELKELFQHIERYTPQSIELECKLKPFIPEYIPAIGDIDAFLKVMRPDSKEEPLGKTVLDEPRAKQSDPTVLDLQLRTLTKQTTVKPVNVHSIAEPDKQSKALDNWINSISELHRQKPATNVHYTRNMPDIESLMQEWPLQFEEALNEVGLPPAELDCSLAEYVDIVCALLDIPVYKNRVHSLHVLFSLYMEFKNSQHFKVLASEESIPSKKSEEELGDSSS